MGWFNRQPDQGILTSKVCPRCQFVQGARWRLASNFWTFRCCFDTFDTGSPSLSWSEIWGYIVHELYIRIGGAFEDFDVAMLSPETGGKWCVTCSNVMFQTASNLPTIAPLPKREFLEITMGFLGLLWVGLYLWNVANVDGLHPKINSLHLDRGLLPHKSHKERIIFQSSIFRCLRC